MVLGPFAIPKLLLVVPAAAAFGLSVSMLSSAAAVPGRERWVSLEDADAVKLKVPMPGLGKEHVKVWADQNDLMIEGKGDKDTEFDAEDTAPARYNHRVELPAGAYKMDQIKAEMKDGVLKVTVPKINVDEKRKEMFQVKVE